MCVQRMALESVYTLMLFNLDSKDGVVPRVKSQLIVGVYDTMQQ